MWKSRILLWAFLVGALASCMTSKSLDQAFSDDWLDDYKKRADFEARKTRLRTGEEWVLVGKDNAARAAVYVDEKGKTRLNLGLPEGLSADIDIDTDEADVAVKYKWKWGKPKGSLPKPPEDESAPE